MGESTYLELAVFGAMVLATGWIGRRVSRPLSRLAAPLLPQPTVMGKLEGRALEQVAHKYLLERERGRKFLFVHLHESDRHLKERIDRIIETRPNRQPWVVPSFDPGCSGRAATCWPAARARHGRSEVS
jgi:hypothetical protein